MGQFLEDHLRAKRPSLFLASPLPEIKLLNLAKQVAVGVRIPS